MQPFDWSVKVMRTARFWYEYVNQNAVNLGKRKGSKPSLERDIDYCIFSFVFCAIRLWKYSTAMILSLV